MSHLPALSELRNRDSVRIAAHAIAATLLTIVVTGAVFRIVGADPLEAFEAIVDGALGNPLGVEETVMLSGILALAALAVAVPARARLWNIGVEGQIFTGALAAVFVALKVHRLDPALLTVAAMLAGVLAGALWAAIAGLLKTRFGANEVLTTLMLNFIAILLTDYSVGHLFPSTGLGNTTPPVPAGVELPDLTGPEFNLGVVLAILSLGLAHVLLSHTRLGLKIRAVGANSDAARNNGVHVNRVHIAALTIGGGFAGLAGAIVVIGVDGSLARDFSPGYGFIGIAVALLARSRPLWILPAAALFGVLTVGGSYLEPTVGLSAAAALVIEGLFVLLLLAFWVLPPERRGALNQ
jgi:simple sugar transport system permease protein